MRRVSVLLRQLVPVPAGGPSAVPLSRGVASAANQTAGEPGLVFDTLYSPGASAATEDARTVCVIHGLLGVGRNLHTLTRTLLRGAEAVQGRPWKALLLDMRNHGRSSRVSFPAPHDLPAAAADIVALVRRQCGGRAPDVVIGHSLGGKVALDLARQLESTELGAPAVVWVLDSWPGYVRADHGASRGILRILDTLRELPQPLESREQLYSLLRARGMDLSMQHWLGSSLSQERPGEYRFLFNLDGAEEMYNSYCELGAAMVLF